MPIFDPASLHTAIERTLQASNVGAARNAFVVAVTPDGVKAVLSTKVGEHWTIAEYFSIDHTKRIEGGLEIKAVW